MAFGVRIFLIDKDDRVLKIPIARFERIRSRDPEAALPEYKNTRIRYAEVVAKLRNSKPAAISRIICGYLQFDAHGLVDESFLEAEVQTAMSMISNLSLPDESDNIINASGKFAKKRFEQEFRWTPSSELEAAIIQKTFAT